MVPATEPDCMIPIAKPIRSFGVVLDTSEIEAGLKPEIVPFSSRSSSSSQGVRANPISVMTIAMPKPERSSMIFRPYRSASLPQSGWKIKDVMKLAAKIKPAHKPISCSPRTPRSFARYRDRNGVIMVIPELTRNWPIQSTIKLTFHDFNVLFTSFLL